MTIEHPADTRPDLPVPPTCWDAIRDLARALNVEIGTIPDRQWEMYVRDLAAPVVIAVVQDIARTATARWVAADRADHSMDVPDTEAVYGDEKRRVVDDEEPCPDCTMERWPDEHGELYHSNCPRSGTSGQIGPPWLPGPWEKR